jgi:hypothetical protein
LSSFTDEGRTNVEGVAGLSGNPVRVDHDETLDEGGESFAVKVGEGDSGGGLDENGKLEIGLVGPMGRSREEDRGEKEEKD